jgi:hypothetical protein
MNRKLIASALAIAAILLGLFAAAVISDRKTTSSNSTAVAGSVAAQIGATQTDSATPPPPVNTITPALTLSPTAGPPIVTADQNAFCRSGPSQYHAHIGELLAGDSSPILGQNEDSTWWVIEAGYGGGTCWIADIVVTVSGDLSRVPVVAAPPLVPLAPVPERPLGDLDCDRQLPHEFLRWSPVEHPIGIALYEWELQGPEGWRSGTTPYTEEEIVIVCGSVYRWHVRAIDNEGTAGPYSELIEFEMR